MYLQDTIGNTPLVALQRLAIANNNQIFCKLEGNNPAGSVKDRPAYNMIVQALARGDIQTGDTLIEATSGNTGIALAMVAAMLGMKMVLLMPANSTQERKDAMLAYNAELIEIDPAGGMELARDTALTMASQGKGKVLNQFANPDNWRAHFSGTGPEIWQQTNQQVSHFVSAMGTTGTIMGVSKYLKQQDASIQIIGLQPTDGSKIPGIRRWPAEYMPAIFDASAVDTIIDVNSTDAQTTMRDLAQQEGIFAGVSSGGAVWGAMEVAKTCENATIVAIICDRGDRYLSSGVYTQ